MRPDTYLMRCDECCGEIDLFMVQNRVVHILSWWTCCQVQYIKERANFMINLEQVNFRVTLVMCDQTKAMHYG